MRSVRDAFETYVNLNKKVPPETVSSLGGIIEPGRLADTIIAHLNVRISDKQEILALLDPLERLENLLSMIEREVEILQIEKKIRTRVKSQMERSQKEYYLNEQMRAIQKELGEKDEFKQEIRNLEEKIQKKRMSKEATEKAMGELRKLKMMSPMSAEATVVRNYVDWLVSLPWKSGTRDRLDLSGPRRSWKRTIRSGEGQGADSRIPGGPVPGEEDQGTDPLPGRTSRGREDLPRPLDRQGDGAQICPHFPGRHAR